MYGNDVITYSVRQSGENRADLFCSKVTTWYRNIWDNINKVASIDDTTWTTPSELYGKIYLENKRVYFHYGDSEEAPWNKKQLLYDFNLNVGDEFMISDYYKFSVISIDSAFVGNGYRKKYNFAYKQENVLCCDFSVIEGIGCTEDLFLLRVLDPFITSDPLPPTLIEVYYKDKLIWRKK